MAKKTLLGKVVSDKMQKTVVVEVERLIQHPVYKKIVKKNNKIKADVNGLAPKVGQFVKIEQAKPISSSKNFVVIKIVKEEELHGTA